MGNKRFPAFAGGVLLYSLAVIVWGYFLRISESGDGCGTDWPLCNGEVVPASVQFPTWVEYTHRVSSGIALCLVLFMAIWSVYSFRRGHPVRRAAGASLLFMLTESLFGALLVVFGWVAGDISTGRILIRPFHVTNTFLLMASLGLTAWWAARRVEQVTSWGKADSRGLRLAALALIALAASGSWTGLAGTAFPAPSLSQGLGQYLDPEHLLIYLRTLHPLVAVLAFALLVRVLSGIWRQAPTPIGRRLVGVIAVLSGGQLLIGPLTIVLLHPTGLRLLHLLLADLLWLSLLFLWSLHTEQYEPRRVIGKGGAAANAAGPDASVLEWPRHF